MRRTSEVILISSTFLMSACYGSPTAAPATPATTPSRFIEGDIRIVPPARVRQTNEGAVDVDSYNDGGTKMVTIIDATGKTFDVYVDHRVGKGRGIIYLHGYPGERGSIRLVKQAEFRAKVL